MCNYFLESINGVANVETLCLIPHNVSNVVGYQKDAIRAGKKNRIRLMLWVSPDGYHGYNIQTTLNAMTIGRSDGSINREGFYAKSNWYKYIIYMP